MRMTARLCRLAVMVTLALPASLPAAAKTVQDQARFDLVLRGFTAGSLSFSANQQGEGYAGKRLVLTKLREETNTSVVEMFRKKQPVICAAGDDSNKYLVHFQVDDIRPLVGDKA